MAVTLDEAEIEDFLTNGHTLVFTTVDKDGYPHSTPLWYVYMDGHIYTRGRAKSQKARNVDRDKKVCCLVETGELWRELKAVMIRGRAELLEEGEELQRFTEALTEKYKAFREPAQNMPGRAQQHYASSSAHWKVTPEKKLATWDNRKMRLAGS